MLLHTCSVDVEVGDVQDFEFGHEWLCVGTWWEVLDESYYTFVGSG